jgi:Domain of unknown function (DUF222)
MRCGAVSASRRRRVFREYRVGLQGTGTATSASTKPGKTSRKILESVRDGERRAPRNVGAGRDNGRMMDSPVVAAHRQLADAIAGLRAAIGSAGDDELVSMLAVCEGASRQLDLVTVEATAALSRRGVFAERGYKTPVAALCDLLGWERFEARRRVVAAEQVGERISLDGRALPAKLVATARAFGAGQASLRHVEVIARVLASPAAARLSPEVWAGAEEQLAGQAGEYTPAELATWGTSLVELLDQDGAAPDDAPPQPLNQLHLVRHSGGAGGNITGRIDDSAMFDTITTVLEAISAPRDGDDNRGLPERQAAALAEVCGYVLDHGQQIPQTGGHRPHLNVHIGLADLEHRCHSAVLDSGGTLTPQALRTLACDARVIPIVLNGAGQPLDVGRMTRTIPDGLRRAVTARDRGCAHPGCARPPGWCEVHHIRPWSNGGETALHNSVMVCRFHHWLLHHESGWTVHIVGGVPEFIPPRWIDPHRRPRRKPLIPMASWHPKTSAG